MGKLFKRWNRDKKFRRNVFIALIVFMFLSSGFPDTGTQATRTPQPTCDQKITANSCEDAGCFWTVKAKSNDRMVLKGTYILGSTGAGCAAGFAVGGASGGVPAVITTPLGCVFGVVGGLYSSGFIESAIDWTVGLFTSPCYSCIPAGYLVDNPNDCCSEVGSYVTVESAAGLPIFDKTSYVCYEPTGDEVCKSWMKPFKNILDGVWKGNKIDCSAAAYLVIGFGAFALLAVI